VPPKFSWEVRQRKKSICMTIPKSFGELSSELVDFVFKQNGVNNLEVVLWKIKNYDENYIGQFELEPTDFFDCEVA
jgi:hypothetical protein